MATTIRARRGQTMIRLYITAITIELKKAPKYPIYVGVLVDGERVHELPPIAEDLPLRWSVNRPIDVKPQSQVTFQVKEFHRVRIWQGDLGSCMLSDHPDWLKYNSAGAQKEISQQVENFTISVKFSPPQGIKDTQLIIEQAVKVTGDAREGVLGKLGQARTAVETIVSLLEHVEDVHPIAKVALSTLTKAFKFLEEEEAYDESMGDLASGMADMLSFVETVNEHAKIVQLKATIAQMMLMVEDASRFILDSQSTSIIRRTAIALVSSQRREKIDEYIKHFETLRAGFDRGVAVQILDLSSEVLRVVSATEKRSLEDHERLLLDKLPVARSARYDPSRSCMDGTRTKVLDDIINWVHRPAGSATFIWIHGTAGAGKSSIASSTACELERRKMLGATFFCSRDKPELRDPALMLPTIAARLAVVFPALGKAIADELRQDPQLGESALQFQYEGLFASPVKQIGTSDIDTRSTPLVIVIDALDECGSAESRKTLLNYLLQISGLTGWLKVIATSRPLPDIDRLLTASSICTSFPLRLDDNATFDDILLFTQARMAEIAKNDELQPSDWPGRIRTKQLAERAGGLFIWAQTASLFIADGQDPEECLQLILSMQSPPGAYARLDTLYTTAIMGTFGTIDGGNLEKFRQVVGTIVTTQTPLPIQAIYELLQERISLVAIRKIVRNLGSVLYEDEKNHSVIRVCHLSFTDFVTDASRCPQFFIDPRQHHRALAVVSLHTMRDRLRFNICDVESSDLFNDQIPGLSERVNNAIPIPLKYCCVHWMTHLRNSSRDAPLVGALELFLAQTTVLFWIEVLSLSGEVPAAIQGLPRVVGWFQEPENPNSQFIADIHRFILGFKEPITLSAPHLYISALPFAPKQSLVSTRFLPSFQNVISLDDRESFWSPCLQTLEGHTDHAFDVSWSPDGQRLVSGSFDKTICVWDSTTGAMLQRLRGHSHNVICVAFSPNNQFIASGSRDMTIQIWDVETGIPTLPPLLGHTSSIRRVIFSPDGRHLASCSSDQTIRLWDATIGNLVLDPFEGHSDWVCGISYSPVGERIVSGSRDETVRVWDVKTGRTVLGPLTAHSDEVHTVDFSPDGRHILSASCDYSMIIWDSATGLISLGPLRVEDLVSFAKFSPDSRLILSTTTNSRTRIWDAESGAELFNEGHSGVIYSACFSPNGQHFVTGSSDRTVRIWDSNSLSPVVSSVTDSWHTDLVTSVAFSPDDKYILSGSKDKTVRVWHASTGISACAPLRGHTGHVTAVTFSPNGQHILSASLDSTLRLWSVGTWECTMEPLSGHTKPIYCAVFSPDGHLIISGSSDHTIRLWNPVTGKETCNPLRGHKGVVISLDISSDGRLIGSGSGDETVKIWDSTTRHELFSLFIGAGKIWSIKFSPDSQFIASFSDNADIWLCDVSNQVVLWKKLSVLGSSGPGYCIFSRHGRHLFYSSTSFIYILDAATGSTIGSPFQGHSTFIRSLAISPNGKHLISGSEDYTIRAWDIEFEVDENCHELVPDAQKLSKPVGHDGWVRLESGDPLLWIPAEYRDGLWKRALFSIPPTAGNHPRTLDCSRFRHGDTWTEVRST